MVLPPTPPDEPETLAEMLTANLPASVLSGSKLRARATVQVANRSPAAVNGPATLRLYLSSDENVDGTDVQVGGTDVQVGEMRTNLKLRVGAGRKLNVKLATLPVMPDGSYRLLARLDRPDGGTDVIAAANAVAVAAPTIVIRPTGGRTTMRNGGTSGTAEVVIENSGNVPARGSASLRLTVPQPGAPVLADVPARLNIPPGRSATIRVRFVVPPAAVGSTNTVLASLSAGSIAGAVVPVDGATTLLFESPR